MASHTAEQLERNRFPITKDIGKDVPIVNEVAHFLLSKLFKNNTKIQPHGNNNFFDEKSSNMLVVVGQELAKSAHTSVRRPREEGENNNNNNDDDANAQARPEEKNISDEVAVGAVATMLVLNFDNSISAVDIDKSFGGLIAKFGEAGNTERVVSVVNFIATMKSIQSGLNLAIGEAMSKFRNNNNNNNNNVIAGDNAINLSIVWKFYCNKLFRTSPYIKNRPLPPTEDITIFDAITARHDRCFNGASDFSAALKCIGVKVATDERSAESLTSRFVRPVGTGKLLQVPLQLVCAPNHPNQTFQPTKNNIVVGVSGDGKTIAPFTQAATWNDADILKTNVEKGFVVYAVADADRYERMFKDVPPDWKNLRNKLAVKYLFERIASAFATDEPPFPSHTIAGQTAEDFVKSFNQVDNNNNNSGANYLRAACASSIPNSQLQTKSCLHRLYVVLDEMGPCPLLVRGLCAVWEVVRIWLAREVFLMDPSKLFLVTTGTGVQSNFSEVSGSMPDTFTVFTVNTRCLFREHLRSLVSANTTSFKGKILLEKFDTELFEPVPKVPAGVKAPALQDSSTFQSLPHLGRNHQRLENLPIEFRIRVTGTDFIRYRFAQVVTFNARAAAIAAACLHLAALHEHGKASQSPQQAPTMFQELIQQVTAQFNACAGDLQPLFENPNNDQAFASALPLFTESVVIAFKDLNGLREVDDPMLPVADALRVAMSRTSTLDEEPHGRLCTQYGLLRQLPDNTFEICPSFAAMFLLHKNLNASAVACRSPWDMFEHVVAEHHALVLLLKFTTRNVNPKNKFITIFQGVAAVAAAPVETLTKGLSDSGRKLFTKELDAKIVDSWRSRILRNEAVVLVNGPTASFADVIVLTPGRIFLTQCNYYEPNSKCDAQEEFKKMHTDNPNTMKLLIECCKSGNQQVEVICSIVFKFQDQKNVSPAYEPKATPTQVPEEGFSYTEHFLYAFPFTEDNAPGRSWSETNMFPVFVAAFEPQLKK